MQALAESTAQGPPAPPSIEDALALALQAVHAEFGWLGVIGLAVTVLGFVVGLGAKLWAKRSRQHLVAFVHHAAGALVTRSRHEVGLALVSLWRFWGTMHSTESPAEFLRLASKHLMASGVAEAEMLAADIDELIPRARALEPRDAA
jgi:hypothetical protein